MSVQRGSRQEHVLAILREQLALADEERREAPLPVQRTRGQARYETLRDLLNLLEDSGVQPTE
jgi:hypothetical protein